MFQKLVESLEHYKRCSNYWNYKYNINFFIFFKDQFKRKQRNEKFEKILNNTLGCPNKRLNCRFNLNNSLVENSFFKKKKKKIHILTTCLVTVIMQIKIYGYLLFLNAYLFSRDSMNTFSRQKFIKIIKN